MLIAFLLPHATLCFSAVNELSNLNFKTVKVSDRYTEKEGDKTYHLSGG